MSIHSTFLVINSKNRNTESASTSNFTYSIGQSLEVESIVIKSISIPNTQYNINNSNNKIYFYYMQNTGLVEVPNGQYTISQLLAKLNTSFIGYGNTVFTQDENTFKISYTSAVGIAFFSGDDSSSGLMKTLGQPTTTSEYTNFTFQNLPSLNGLMNYYILTKVLSQGSNGLFTGGIQTALQTNIPITVPYGQIQNYRPLLLETNTITFTRPVNIQFIDIKIVDSSLNEVDLNGADIELIYKLYLK